MKKEIEEYYQKYGQKVYAYLVSICREPDTAQDLTQETFLQALRSLDRFDSKCSVCTWLCQIAKFLWLKELKRRKYHPSASKETDLAELDKCIGVHTLRHTFASRLFASGVDVKTVSELLGHSEVGITYDTYIHLMTDTLRGYLYRKRQIPPRLPYPPNVLYNRV